MAALRSLTLTDFRNWRGRVGAAAGDRGAARAQRGGQDQPLEAVSLLAPGKGLRNAAAAELGRREPGEPPGRPWTVSAQVEGAAAAADEEPTRLGTGLEPGASRRIVRIEGETAPAARLSDHLRLVWLTPAQDRLFAGGRERASALPRPPRLRGGARPRRPRPPPTRAPCANGSRLLARRARRAGAAADPAWLDALEARHGGERARRWPPPAPAPWRRCRRRDRRARRPAVPAGRRWRSPATGRAPDVRGL